MIDIKPRRPVFPVPWMIPFFGNVKDMTNRKTLKLWIVTGVSFTLCFPYF